MVLGKFLPPHTGHIYLFDFARNYVDDLAIIVETKRDEPIPGELRFNWVRNMFPNCQVFHLTDENPQDPSEHPDFWTIWKNSLERLLPWTPDYVFASENYGWKLAETLKAQFIPLDIARTVMPISGTQVRHDPLGNWKYLPRITRPYFALRVCVFGPESTGKSTLTQRLAEHYNTCYVPEYARTHLELRQGAIDESDMEPIARGQLASEEALAFEANRILFCDTDLLTTSIWSHWLYKRCSPWIETTAAQRSYALYLLTDVDVPWVEDCVRYLPNERETFLSACIAALEKQSRPYIRVSGGWDERFQTAVRAVDRLLLSDGCRYS